MRNAVRYVLHNQEKHTGWPGLDEFSSAAQPQLVFPPRTWLLVHAPPAGS